LKHVKINFMCLELHVSITVSKKCAGCMFGFALTGRSLARNHGSFPCLRRIEPRKLYVDT